MYTVETELLYVVISELILYTYKHSMTAAWIILLSMWLLLGF